MKPASEKFGWGEIDINRTCSEEGILEDLNLVGGAVKVDCVIIPNSGRFLRRR